MGSRDRHLISTQYARNGPLIDESQMYTRLVAAGVDREERRKILLVENGLGRPTHKTRRSIFEALEQRFADDRRASNLGVLSAVPGQARSFAVGVLMEIARHDQLVGAFLAFLAERTEQSWMQIDARLFLEKLYQRDDVVPSWAPSIQKRAVSSLNSIPRHFQLWRARVGSRVTPISLPAELVGMIVFERLSDGAPVEHAPDFATFGMRKQDIVEALWSCSRRGWFAVDVIGDVISVESKVNSVSEMFTSSQGAGIYA